MGDKLPPALLVAAAAVAEVVVEEAVVGRLELQVEQRVGRGMWSWDSCRCPIATPREHV